MLTRSLLAANGTGVSIELANSGNSSYCPSGLARSSIIEIACDMSVTEDAVVDTVVELVTCAYTIKYVGCAGSPRSSSLLRLTCATITTTIKDAIALCLPDHRSHERLGHQHLLPERRLAVLHAVRRAGPVRLLERRRRHMAVGVRVPRPGADGLDAQPSGHYSHWYARRRRTHAYVCADTILLLLLLAGSYACTWTGSVVGVNINGVPVNILQSGGSNACQCNTCDGAITYSAVFAPFNLPFYSYGGSNNVTLSILSGSICLNAVNVTTSWDPAGEKPHSLCASFAE